MIITRTPLRISIGGGGTDLPSYYERYGGFCISAAIDRYVYIALHDQNFARNYFLKYSKQETVERLDQIEHPIIREVFTKHSVEPGIEMASFADLPAGTGLGSSGTFTVGLLRAVHALKRNHVPTQELAEEACDIEINRLKEPVGKQDQYIAAFGGITSFQFAQDGTVQADPLRISSRTLHDLEDNLLMFFTGYSRSASTVLADQKKKSEKDDKAMLDNLSFIRELGQEIKKSLEDGQPDEFGRLMHRHWLHKRERTQGMSNPNIDRWYDLAMKNGASGGKLVGAGGGGFLLFYTHERNRLRDAMAAEGLQEIRFFFDMEGSKVIAQD